MNRKFRLPILALASFSCFASVVFHSTPSALTMPNDPILGINPIATSVDLGALHESNFKDRFQDLGIEGSIAIYDLNADRFYEYNSERNATAFSPASTFKILNSLIALETKVLADEISILTWDGIQRQIPEWNRDLNMREAYRRSAVWFYQAIARRVGHEQMQKLVAQSGYGNQKIGSKENIDKFWLNGDLKITPREQIQFLRRLYKNDLPFSERSLAIVKDIMILEKTPAYTLRGKTGWAGFGEKGKNEIGWFVGYLENDNRTYFFATNIDIRDAKKDPAARIEVTRRCLKEMGFL